MAGKTLYENVWECHIVDQIDDRSALIYIDRHLVHEVSSPQAFAKLEMSGRTVRRPDAHLAVADHAISTGPRNRPMENGAARDLVSRLETNAERFGIPFIRANDARQGIVHVIGPELGFTLPGTTLVCGDSHTCTHGAFGALAFGIGSSECEHVFATQCLVQPKSRSMRISLSGTLALSVTVKDVVLHLIARIGTAGAAGYAIEYAGDFVESLSMEGRMTLCNMSVESGARIGMVAPDEKTFAYLSGRPFAPVGEAWDAAVENWRGLCSDSDAVFDRELGLDVTSLEPQVTWGTSPQDAAPISGRVPDPADEPDAGRSAQVSKSLGYMGLKAGTRLEDIAIDRVFIGSCTNGRIEDLRAAARVVEGRRVAANVKAMVVPGSTQVRSLAEAEGLASIFREAGFEWREAGCSMCVAMNGDKLTTGERCASTSNRNFEGRQGPGSRTHLMSPQMAAAAAITGHLADVRTLER